MKDKIEKFEQYIRESNRIVFFGGAGVSTESGIPDFRSKDGLYNQHDVKFEKYSPAYLLSNSCWRYHPKVFYEFYRQKMDVRNIEPNITHLFLAKLEKMGKLSVVVTQNIDGLHQKAGSQNVLEIHGTTQRNYCHKCKKEYPANYIFEVSEPVPHCECGGIVRPDVTLYEENLPNNTVEDAIEAIRRADMLIIAGTSLKVQPAASFVYYFEGKHIVVVNRESLKKEGLCLSDECDLEFNCSMGEVFKELDKRLF